MANRQKETHILADMHTHLHEKRLEPKEWWEQVKEKNLKVVETKVEAVVKKI